MKKIRHLVGWSLAFLLFTGCSSNFAVRIPHLFSANQTDLERLEQISRVYLLVQKPSNGLLNTLINLATKPPENESKNYFVGSNAFAYSFQNNLSLSGGGVCAYREVENLSSTDPYLEAIAPSSILTIKFEPVHFNYTEIKKEIKETDRNGRAVSRIVSEWTYKGQLVTHFKFLSSPDNKVLFETDVSNNLETVSPVQPSEFDYGTMLFQLSEEASKNIVTRLRPPVVVRDRMLFETKDQPDSKKALQLAKNQNWGKAEEIWKLRLSSGTGNWRDKMNLGVNQERQRDYTAALQFYKEAQTDAGDDKEAKGISWDQIYEDLNKTQIKKYSGPDRGTWFGKRVVILPFTDETNSIDGPELIRSTIFLTLKNGGYNVIPIEDSDQTLSDGGISDGGQLPVIQPKKLADWLKADWLIYGDIDDFREVNIGIYNKRSVSGTITIWDAKTGKEFRSIKKSVKTENAIKKDENVLTHFLVGLGTSLIEHAGHSPLSNEVHQFVALQFEGFPLRP